MRARSLNFCRASLAALTAARSRSYSLSLALYVSLAYKYTYVCIVHMHEHITIMHVCVCALVLSSIYFHLCGKEVQSKRALISITCTFISKIINILFNSAVNSLRVLFTYFWRLPVYVVVI